MTTIIENLTEALKGETIALKKYELFAEQAEKENHLEIARLFKAISFAESIHIKNHAQALSKVSNTQVMIEKLIEINESDLKKQVKDTRNNLIQAIAGETFEFKKMYKSFVKNAKKEDEYIAEYSFNLARKAEIVHSKLFINYLKKLDKKEIVRPIDIYVCIICGNAIIEKPTENCPNCDHDVKFFKKFDYNSGTRHK